MAGIFLLSSEGFNAILIHSLYFLVCYRHIKMEAEIVQIFKKDFCIFSTVSWGGGVRMLLKWGAGCMFW